MGFSCINRQLKSSLFAFHLLVVSLLKTLLELSRKLVVASLADRLQIQLKELCPNDKHLHIKRTDHS